MNYQAVIFDLDGVICSTDRFHYEAWKALADQLHIYFDEEINHRLRGVSRLDSLDIVLERSEKVFSNEEKLRLAEDKNERYKKLLDQMTTADLSEEVRDTLETIKKRGYRIAIGSSSCNTKRILERIGLTHTFDAVSDGTNITYSKPHPEVFLKAAQYLNLAPEQCLVVEDAAAGIEAARRGGFDVAGLGEAAAHEKTTYPLTQFAQLLTVL